MKLLLIAFSILLLNNSAFSQTIQEVKADQKNYFWGEGSGTTLKKADNDALSMLINQISTQVESRFELLKEETGNEYKEKFNSVIKTYSAATLKNTERIVTGEEPDAKVFRYIKRSELDKIFTERKNKIIEFAKNAGQALNEFQIADALKYYYWALTLLKSHPDGNTIKYTGGELMATWLPAQINNIFAGVSASLGELKKEQGYSTQILQINYKGTPVSNYDYTYWDGKNWSNIISAKDGTGFVEFAGTNTDIKEVKLKTEYVFEGEAAIDKELQDVMQKIEPVPFRNSNIIAKPVDKKEQVTLSKVEGSKYNLPFTAVADKTPYFKSVEELKKSIRSGNYESAKPLFTETGFDMFKQLVQYGKARILADKELSFLKQGDEVMCRAIPMSFSFKNNNKQFVEDLVLNFNAEKKISSLSFALGEKAISDIAVKTAWPEKVRALVINFMENYKTAYALKRLDYIESIFSDDALIIIGSLLKVQPNEMNKYKDNKIVKYNRYTKQEYIKNLKFAFKSTEYINLKFEDNEIRKSGKGGEIYGIQIKQNYVSANYSDAGYLFLLIDFNDPDKPSIHVRTWQPEKNPDGSIYGVSDFN
ncbi:MAG: LPP20 family lipoprotein [Bacteroidia bacterium]|nr:LPP20 family lipoprotein [Bacteroidia bacterium]